MMTEKFEELYSELNAMDSQEIKNAIEEAIKKGCKNIIAPFEVRSIIEAQQAEIEALKEAKEKAQATAAGVIKRQDAEIERLKSPCEMQIEVSKELENDIKSEAIKEFTERLKEKQQTFIGHDYTCKFIYLIEIDNLVKEMVGAESG